MKQIGKVGRSIDPLIIRVLNIAIDHNRSTTLVGLILLAVSCYHYYVEGFSLQVLTVGIVSFVIFAFGLISIALLGTRSRPI